MTARKQKTKLSAVEAVAGECALMKEALQEVLEGEMSEFLGAAPRERFEGRNGYHAGYYSRNLVRRIGKLELRAPQDRGENSPLPCLNTTHAARKRWWQRWPRCMCKVSPPARSRPSLSNCAVTASRLVLSAAPTRLDQALARFANRRLEEDYPYLILDARYEKVREEGVIAIGPC